MSQSIDATLSARPRKYNHDEIGALYMKGHSAMEVAKRVGCSVSLVVQVVNVQRIVRPRKESHMVPLTEDQRQQIASYRRRGWAWIRIAIATQISVKTLMKQCVGPEFDKITNCERCQRTLVNAQSTQKYCPDCSAKIKAENARFYNEQYQKRLHGEIEAGEPGAKE